MTRTSNGAKIYHGEDAARTAGALWRDGDLFVVRATGASYVRTDGAWVQISVGSGTEDHESLTGLQGGTTNEHYHLTAAQHTDLTDGGNTTLHVHDAYVANALLTAQGDLLVRNGTVPARLALVVPDAPTINYLGVANGETDPTWKSTSSTGAADAHVVATDASGYTAVKKLISGERNATAGSVLVQAYYDDNPAQTLITEYSTGAMGLAQYMYQNASATWLSSFAYGSLRRSALTCSIYSLSYITAPAQNVAVGNALTTQPITVFSVSDTGNIASTGYTEMVEITAPSAGASNTARLFCRDNGGGKSQLCVIFATGAIQIIATEP